MFVSEKGDELGSYSQLLADLLPEGVESRFVPPVCLHDLRFIRNPRILGDYEHSVGGGGHPSILLCLNQLELLLFVALKPFDKFAREDF